ncbi:MAG TPA: MFS transporter [Methylophilaceae bacterium]|nr:MFS transporter [Methylophilaceae bacterium]
MQFSEKMTRTELRATVSLASIYGLRMLGMFLILPIFAIYAEKLDGGSNHTLIGLALGAYGLMQVLLQLPFGMASDKYGRKKLIYVGLVLFAIGGLVAAFSHDIYMVIVGRAIQGAGAISAVVTALVADSTREEHRTQAMAMIGATIGLTFAVSLVAGPLLNQWIGVPGIFILTTVLSLLAILVVKYAVPDPLTSKFHSDAQAAPQKIKDVIRDAQLLRLNFGTFCLHGAQMAMFIVVPFALKETSGMSENQHWQVYLPVLILSFALMIPAIIYGEKRAKLKPVFIAAVGLMLIAQLAFANSIHHFWGIVGSLLVYFVAFNILEASLPSLISKMAPAASKGTAMGVHNTAQSFGMFLGATVGGFLSHHYGYSAVFIFCAILMTVWLVLAFGMKTPPSIKTKMYHIAGYNEQQAHMLAANVALIAGVQEAVAIAEENMLIVKVNNQQSKEAQAEVEQVILKLIGDQ